jgi:2-amino-4-hydroxy-6-hydroxymethyldihydropteridine diphosphokinase
MRSRSRCAVINERPPVHVAYVGLGSNRGDRQIFIAYGIRRISNLENTTVTALSGLYLSEPNGVAPQNPFLNMVLQINTRCEAGELLLQLQSIEREAGRYDDQHDGNPRVLDLDILFFNDSVIKKNNLRIPHPALHRRKFVLYPLCDITRDFMHPVKKKTVMELLDGCKDKGWVYKITYPQILYR